jgi:hypothetical protein
VLPGRQNDVRKHLAIEDWSMAECRRHYECRGFDMLDTGQTKPYDFIASEGERTRRVEVKGCTGSLGDVIVTSGEISAARQTGIVTGLFVLSEGNKDAASKRN